MTLQITGCEDFSAESLELMALFVEGDLAGYDQEFADSPHWVAFWRTHAESMMLKMLEIIRRYEELRASTLMTLKRYAAKRDANEPAIVQVLRKCGVAVAHLSLPGMPDLLCCYRGRLFLLEVKQAKGKPTPAQAQVQRLGWPVVTVRSITEALTLLGVEHP